MSNKLKKPWKCFLGFHDMEPISDRERVARDDDNRSPWVYDKACIRPGCHTFDLKATKLQTARDQKKIESQDRKAMANDLAQLYLPQINHKEGSNV